MIIYHYIVSDYERTRNEQDRLLVQQLNQGYKIVSATPIFEMSNGSYCTTEIIYVLQQEED